MQEKPSVVDNTLELKIKDKLYRENVSKFIAEKK